MRARGHEGRRLRGLEASSGFTLIELLIVVAIVGLIAAIAIPNLISAVDRSRQKRTMADMRVIGAACEEYSLDFDFFPVQTHQGSVTQIADVLAPSYAKALPEKDGWGWSVQYGTAPAGAGYTVRSLGKDGVKNGVAGPTADFNCDIVFQQGQFISYPAGVQT